MTSNTLPLFPPAADVPVTDPNRMTITLVADEDRPDFWPQHFVSIPQWKTLEPHILAWMDRLRADYSGGIRCFYTLSNDGAFMSPEPDGDDDEKWALFNPMNGNGGELSTEASGIAVCLMAYSHHAMHTEYHTIMHIID